MKQLLILMTLAMLAVACNQDTSVQREETPASDAQGISTKPDEIQREEDMGRDVEMSEDSATGAGATGSDLGTNRGAGSAAGSSDAAGMGMDEQ